MPLVTTAAGEAVTRGWTDGPPQSDHTPQSLATNTHTPHGEKAQWGMRLISEG